MTGCLGAMTEHLGATPERDGGERSHEPLESADQKARRPLELYVCSGYHSRHDPRRTQSAAREESGPRGTADTARRRAPRGDVPLPDAPRRVRPHRRLDWRWGQVVCALARLALRRRARHRSREGPRRPRDRGAATHRRGAEAGQAQLLEGARHYAHRQARKRALPRRRGAPRHHGAPRAARPLRPQVRARGRGRAGRAAAPGPLRPDLGRRRRGRRVERPPATGARGPGHEGARRRRRRCQAERLIRESRKLVAAGDVEENG